jgi:serine/threonine protein kinase
MFVLDARGRGIRSSPSALQVCGEAQGLDDQKDTGQAAITTTSSGEPEAVGKALPTGAALGEFQIVRVLGEGGFGIVYLAFDQTLHRHVAIKEYFPATYAVRRDAQTITALSPNHADTYRAGMASFIEEARLLARFEHPALLKVLRYWEGNGTAYMVMPHYQGRTLRELLKMPDEFSTEIELRGLMSPLLDAVAVMHDEQCFHRDISPENIIIRPNGAPVLLDFGAARRILGDSTAALTVVLKQNYAPIEQYSDDGALAQGPWTDIYALAAVMYTAIMRKPPPSAVARVYQDPVKPLAKLAPAGFSQQFLRGIDAGMAVKPEDRPRTIAAFREALGLDRPAQAPALAASALAPEPPKPAPEAPKPAPAPRPAAVATPAPKPPPKDPDPTVDRARIIVTPDSRYVPPTATAPRTRVVALVAAAVAVLAVVAGGMYTLGKRTDEAPKVAIAPAPATVAATPVPTPVPVPAPVEPPRTVEPPPPPVSPPPAAETPAPAPAAVPVQPAAPAEPAPPPAPAQPTPAPTPPKAAPPPPAKEKEKEKAPPPKPAPPVAQPAPPPPKVAVVKPVAPPAPVSPPVAEAPRPAPAAEEPEAPRDLSDDGRKLYAAANRGDASAQVALARLYAQGRGAPQSDAEAARWMRKAADQGNPEAWHALGVLYEGGRGVPKDAAEAARWYRRAGERGNAVSQNNLGAIYASGTGVPKDDAEAVAWYRKAAEQGNARGQYNLAMMYLAGQGVAKDDAEAARLLRRAADQGLASAQLQLGAVYAGGRGVMKDEAEALVWYRKAAAQGNAQAAERLKQLESGGK